MSYTSLSFLWNSLHTTLQAAVGRAIFFLFYIPLCVVNSVAGRRLRRGKRDTLRAEAGKQRFYYIKSYAGRQAEFGGKSGGGAVMAVRTPAGSRERGSRYPFGDFLSSARFCLNGPKNPKLAPAELRQLDFSLQAPLASLRKSSLTVRALRFSRLPAGWILWSVRGVVLTFIFFFAFGQTLHICNTHTNVNVFIEHSAADLFLYKLVFGKI